MTRKTRYGLAWFCLALLFGPYSFSQQETAPQTNLWRPLSSREAIEQFLRSAEIVKVKNLGEGVTNPKKMTLSDGKLQHYGVFKSIDERKMGITKIGSTAEYDFKDSWMFEIAAYEVDKLLEMNVVPPTVERTYDGKKGSLQWWVPDAMTEGDRMKKKLVPPNALSWSRQIVVMRIFDCLVYNIDRNLGNILITTDWRVWLIDHSRTFKSIDMLKGEKGLTNFSRSLMERLRLLDEQKLNDCCGLYLRAPEIRTMLKRRDLIIQHYEKMVQEKGAGILFP